MRANIAPDAYQIMVIPMLGATYVHIKRHHKRLGFKGAADQTWTIRPEDTEHDKLYAVLSYIAGDIASEQH